MRRTASIWLLLLTSLVASSVAFACGGDDDDGDAASGEVIATIAPLGALAQAVAGDTLTVRVLAGAGSDPHDYEVTADDRKAVGNAKVIFAIGEGIDEFLDKAKPNKDRVTTVTNGLELREGDEAEEHEGEEGGDDHDHGEHDPHVWHDIDLCKQIVDVIAKKLGEIDAANAATYQKNAAAYKQTLDDTDKQIRDLLKSIPEANRKVVTNHDAFGYFLDRYGLVFVGAVIPAQTTAAEPSAKDIAELVDIIKREKVKAIFAESSVDPKIAQQIAKDTSVRIVDDLFGDSLGEPGSGAETLHGMLLANAKKFSEALK
ncbi:MAG: metal ABC transporter substrate-binding protein [Dehalococcoidia bacterium]